MKLRMNLYSSFQSVSDSVEMEDESPPEKRLRLDGPNNHEQDEIMRLKEVVKEQEKMLASKNKKLLEMMESKNKVEREKIKLEDEKSKFEAKLRKLVECPVCLKLPRKGPVPCCANGHVVCSP